MKRNEMRWEKIRPEIGDEEMRGFIETKEQQQNMKDGRFER